jgi:hypothetical protein
MQISSITLGKSRRVPFVVTNALGGTDTTAVATVASNNQSQVSAVIDPSDSRAMILTAIAPTFSNVSVTVSAQPAGSTSAHSDTMQVFVPTPPDQTAVTIGTPGSEF